VILKDLSAKNTLLNYVDKCRAKQLLLTIGETPMQRHKFKQNNDNYNCECGYSKHASWHSCAACGQEYHDIPTQCPNWNVPVAINNLPPPNLADEYLSKFIPVMTTLMAEQTRRAKISSIAQIGSTLIKMPEYWTNDDTEPDFGKISFHAIKLYNRIEEDTNERE